MSNFVYAELEMPLLEPLEEEDVKEERVAVLEISPADTEEIKI